MRFSFDTTTLLRRSGRVGFALVMVAFACSPIVLGDRETTDSVSTEPDAGLSDAQGGKGGSSADAATTDARSDAADATNDGSSEILPEPGAILWSSDHESGDLSDWERGGTAQGGVYYCGTGNGEVLDVTGRGGSRALAMQIETTPVDTSHGARAYRRVEAAPAFYRAWFRLKEAHSVPEWWAIFLFHARKPSLSLEDYTSLWDVRIVRNTSGEMTLQFFDHAGQTTTSSAVARVEAERWFELRAFLDYRPPDATRLIIWLDGQQVFDMTKLQTALETNVFWIVGNGASILDPALSTVYIDDAAILGVRSGG
jgi:hypothetical protein